MNKSQNKTKATADIKCSSYSVLEMFRFFYWHADSKIILSCMRANESFLVLSDLF